MNKAIVTALSTIWLCASVGMASAADHKPSHIQWTKHKPVEFAPLSANQIPEDQANLVFFREPDSKTEQTAVNIGINDRYQASLRGGNYTSIPSCAYRSTISTEITSLKINDLQRDAAPYNFEPKKNYYFEVTVDSNNVARATPIEEAVALDKIKDNKLQTHTISRVVNTNCQPVPAPVVVEEPPAEKQMLENLFLFDFDARVTNMSELSRVTEFAQKVLAADLGNYQLYLSGYTDPMGTSSYNDALSKDRVTHVATVLAQNGIPAERMRMEAFGENNLVVENCDAIDNRAERNACNHRNRRVRVQVTTQ